MPTIHTIRIEQQPAEIAIKTTHAKMKISKASPHMRLHNELPQMELNQKRPEFEVDWKKVRSESGLRPPVDLTLYMRDMGRQQMADYTIEAVQDGNYLGKLEQPGNRVAQLSRRKSLKTANKELNIGLMPKSSPEIKWDPGYVDISWSGHTFRLEWEDTWNMAEVTLDPPHSVEVFLKNRPLIKITVVEEETGRFAGRHVDENI